MSDESTANQDGSQENNAPAQGGETSATGGFQPITSQADLDRILGERLTRERAKFADYKDLKEKAKQLDQIEESNKTELQKMQEALADAQSEAADLRMRTVKTQLEASLTGVVGDAKSYVEDLNLAKFVDDNGELVEEAVTGLVDRLKSLAGPRTPAPDPSLGAGSKAGLNGTPGSPSDVFASFIQQQLSL